MKWFIALLVLTGLLGCAESPCIKLRTAEGIEVWPLYRAEKHIDNNTRDITLFAAGDDREWREKHRASIMGHPIRLPTIWYCLGAYNGSTQSGELVVMRSVALGGIWRRSPGGGDYYHEERPRYIVIRVPFEGYPPKGHPESVKQLVWDDGEWIEEELLFPEILEVELIVPPREALPLGVPVPVMDLLDYTPPTI